MKALVLCAGLGTRLRPVTETFAKPAVPLLNVKLAYYSVHLLLQAGVKELVFNAHHLPDQIETLARSIPGFDGRIHISNEAQPLGSGGGVWKAIRNLSGNGHFFVANGDEVIIPSAPDVMPKLLAQHVQSAPIATIMVMRHPQVGTKFGAVWADASGQVWGFGKESPSVGGAGVKPPLGTQLTPYHYVGIQLVSDRIIKYLPSGESNLLYNVLVAAIRNGEKVKIFEDQCLWFETGNVADFLLASKNLVQLLEPTPHWYLEAFYRHYWFFGELRKPLRIGRDCQFTAESVRECEPNLLLGDRCQIDPTARLKGVVIMGEDVIVGASAVVENAVIMGGMRLKPGHSYQKGIFFPGN